MATILKGRVLLPDGSLVRGSLAIEGERIVEVRAEEILDPRRAHDPGQTLAPGFIDLQLNGAFGCDLANHPESAGTVAAGLPRHGTTAFLPTLISAPVDSYAPRAATIVEAGRALPPTAAAILGLHLEGPFLSVERKGMHDPAHLHAPREEEIASYLACPGTRLITLAPELEGADRLIAAALARGIVVSAGHSAATYEQAVAAFVAGVRKGTHLFNAMPPLGHRDPGLPGALLTTPYVRAGLIADGLHVHPAVVDLVYRVKGPGGIILVSDAMVGLGQPPGAYDFAGRAVILDGGSARLADGTLAGSIIGQDTAVRNMVAFTRGACGLAEAVIMASTAPAATLGLTDRGSLRPGYLADVVALGPDLQVQATWTRGTLAYEGAR